MSADTKCKNMKIGVSVLKLKPVKRGPFF